MYRKFIVYVHVQYTRFKTQIALIIGMRASASNTRTREEKGGLTIALLFDKLYYVHIVHLLATFSRMACKSVASMGQKGYCPLISVLPPIWVLSRSQS